MKKITWQIIEEERRKKRNELFKFELYLGFGMFVCLIMCILAFVIQYQSRYKDKNIYIISLIGFALLGARFCYVLIKTLVTRSFEIQNLGIMIGGLFGMHLGLTRGIINYKAKQVFRSQDQRNIYIEKLEDWDFSNKFSSAFFLLFFIFQSIFLSAAVIIIWSDKIYLPIFLDKQKYGESIIFFMCTYLIVPFELALAKKEYPSEEQSRYRSQSFIQALSPGFYSSRIFDPQEAEMILKQIQRVKISKDQKFYYEMGFGWLLVANRVLNVAFVACHGFETAAGIKIGIIPIVSFSLCVAFGLIYIFLKYRIQFCKLPTIHKVLLPIYLCLNGPEIFFIIYFWKAAKSQENRQLKKAFSEFIFRYNLVTIFIDDLVEIVYQCLFMGLNRKVEILSFPALILVVFSLAPKIHHTIQVYCYGAPIQQQQEQSTASETNEQNNGAPARVNQHNNSEISMDVNVIRVGSTPLSKNSVAPLSKNSVGTNTVSKNSVGTNTGSYNKR